MKLATECDLFFVILRITKLQEEAAAKLIQISWRRYKYAKVRIGDDDDFVLRESQIASFSASYRNKNFKDELMSRRRSRNKLKMFCKKTFKFEIFPNSDHFEFFHNVLEYRNGFKLASKSNSTDSIILFN